MQKNAKHILLTSFIILFALSASKGMGAVTQDRQSGDNPVVITINCVDGAHGDEVCIGFIVENFEDIAGLQLVVRFDPLVLEYVGIQDEALSGSTSFLSGPNELRYLWTDPLANGVTLPNGSLFMEVCFNIVGPPGAVSPIEIIDLINLPIEFTDSNSENVEVIVNACDVEVLNSNTLGAIVSSCGAEAGLGDGSFTVTVFGGTGPYTVDWVHTTMPSINGMEMVNAAGESTTVNTVAGTYAITITDNDGNIFMLSVDIEPVSFLVNIAGFDPTCFDYTNGRISVEATEGQPPYGFIWKHATNAAYHGAGFINFAGGAETITSLPTGMYYITITDDLGCAFQDTIDLQVEPFSIQENVTDATCEGALDGRVEFSFSGATPLPGGVYEIMWQSSTDQANSLIAVMLDPGEYSLTLTDDRGCDTVHTVTVGSTTEISGDVQITDASCQGSNDGEVFITGLTNGSVTGPYSFIVFDENDDQVMGGSTTDTTLTIQDLAPGDYYAMVAENPCISDTLFFTISISDPVGVQLVNIKANSCLAVNDGSIEVQGTGGTIGVGSDYQYDWSIAQTGALVTGLPAGNYTVTVTDDNGCSATMSFVVTQAVGPQIDTILVDNVSCDGSPTATLTVVYTEGSAPVTHFNWDNGDNGVMIDSLSPGSYTVTIRDSLFCFDIGSAVVPGQGAMVMDSVIIDNPTCPGYNDGQITIYASGGVSPYTYIWSTGDTTMFNLFPGLSAGDYSVTVIDAEECSTVDTTVTLTDPEGLTFAFDGIDTVSCAEVCDGVATVTPSGGMPGMDYQFSWESGFMETGQSSTAIDLCTGYQSVTVTQDGECFFVDSVFIPAPVPITAAPVITDVSCYGQNDGEVSLNLSGGNPGYTVTWNTLPDGSDQTGLSAGRYYYAATDANGCMYSDSILIMQPDSLVATLDSMAFKPLSCGGTNDGVIAIQVEGGTPDYTYQWTPDVSQTAMASDLGAGNYTIVAVDANNCTDTVEVSLSAPDPIVAFFPAVVPPVCTGDQTFISVDSATGGNGPYFFTINQAGHYDIGEEVQVPAGIYTISVQDESGCVLDSMFIIEEPDPILMHVDPDDPILKLGDSLQLQLVFDQLNHPVNVISWSNNGPLSCYDCQNPVAANVQPTTYTVTVTDTAGCTQSLEVFVDVDDSRFVYIPNIFSPNGDGINDEFKVFTGHGVERVPSFRIFDRWGQVVFERLNLLPNNGLGTEGWDGTRNGKAMLPGVYVYAAEIEFADGKVLVYRGDITLVR